MATSESFINYVCEQLQGIGEITYKKMFGEYMVYLNGKPVITVCDNIAYVKELEEIADLMQGADKGFPYKGAKEHHILDIENTELSKTVVSEIEKVTPMPKPRRKKNS